MKSRVTLPQEDVDKSQFGGIIGKGLAGPTLMYYFARRVFRNGLLCLGVGSSVGRAVPF